VVDTDSGAGWLIAGRRILWPGGSIRPGWLGIQGQRITSLGEGAPPRCPEVDSGEHVIVPGFVDIHVHGGGGGSFQSGDLTEARVAAAYHRRHGTTALLASLVSAPLPEMIDAAERLATATAERTIAGVHLEGPFLSTARRGAHSPEHLRLPTAESVQRLLLGRPGVVRMLTLAPELPGALAAVRRLVAAGIVVAAGHTDASYEQTKAAVAEGVTVATHLFNGMRPGDHRRPGPPLACLEDDEVAVEMIVDGFHLHPSVVRMAQAMAGPRRTVLVSDAIPATGAGDGNYFLGEVPIVVTGGMARLSSPDVVDREPGGRPTEAGGSLAGSTLTLDAALRNAVGAGIALEAAVAACTEVPARVIGLANEVGALALGRQADLVMLDDALHVVAVLAAGRWVDLEEGRAGDGGMRRHQQSEGSR
jgi:N-acetylglucosamine-6-phosphate deacetylase